MPETSSTLLEGLNTAQRVAVTSPASVVQILAPPGSGKTKTLTARVSHLLSHHGYSPENTVCLTFTIKSAREMQERITTLLGQELSKRLILGTFHSVCRRYLVAYGRLIGIRKGFGIADSNDSKAIINRIVKRERLTIDAKAARSRISKCKSKSKSIEMVRAEASKERSSVDQKEFLKVFDEYEKHLTSSNLLDYDDLLLQCVKLLEKHPKCVENVEAVLVDEFQDTNSVQFDLLNLLAAYKKRITTVGDPDQSIYGWRSAEIKNLTKMQKMYPDTLVIHLEENYRSSSLILAAASEVIKQDSSRPDKALLPTHGPGTTPVLRKLPSSFDEAQWIVSEIIRCRALTGESLLDYSDFAILLRSASLSRQIETVMGREGIPYRMVGGFRFFDRVEVKILLDYLRCVSQPDNGDALARILNVPKRGIGDNTIKAFLEEAHKRKLSMFKMLQKASKGDLSLDTKVTKKHEQGFGALLNLIVSAQKKLKDSTALVSPRELLEYIIKRLDYKDFLKKTYGEEDEEDREGRWSNVEELLAQAADLGEEAEHSSGYDDDTLPHIQGLDQDIGTQSEDALTKFLANVSLATELQESDNNDESNKPVKRVTLSTIHSSKGLEFPVVFIPSVCDGVIPHSRAEDADEELRIFYVALTRAKVLLYLSCPLKNSMGEKPKPSPFLSSPKVLKCLANKGPSLNRSVVKDIARILGRKCPSEEIVLKTERNAHSKEDDQWAVDCDEDEDSEHVKSNNQFHQRLGKRRRPDDECDRSTVYHRGWQPGTTDHNTTMRNSTNFSCPPQAAGFMSAALKLTIMEQEQKAREIEKAEMELLRAKSSEAAKGGTNGKRKQIKGQGTLTSFFQPKNSASTNLDVSANTQHEEAQQEIQTTMFRPASRSRSPLPAFRAPMSALAPSLANRPLPRPSRHNINRPPTSLEFDSGKSASHKPSYVFLSSSPPPEENLAQIETASELALKNEHKRQSKSELKAEFRPAATLHKTSFGCLADGRSSLMQEKRRTLGLRRTVANSGSATAFKPFSAPSRRGIRGDSTQMKHDI